MGSVRKLVLLPVDEFQRLTQGREDELSTPPREVQVPAPTPAAVPPVVSEAASEEKVGPPLPQEAEELHPGPTSPPSPSQRGRGGEEEEGQAKEEEEEEEKTPYVTRQSTGKRVSVQQQKKDAGVWRPPGQPRLSRRHWIHL